MALKTLVSGEFHITDFAWDDEGEALVFASVQNPDIESKFLYGTDISIVDVESGQMTNLVHFPSFINQILRVEKDIYFIASADPKGGYNSSQCIYRIPMETETGGPYTYERYAHGEEDCVSDMQKAGKDVLVHVQHGMEDQIRMLNHRMPLSRKRKIEAWHVVFTTDGDEIVLAMAQGSSKEPPEVFTFAASGSDLVKLSSHGSELLLPGSKQVGNCAFYSCTSSDGKVELGYPFLIPFGSSTERPLPTVVYIHGGPYYQVTDVFDLTILLWTPLLLAAGYAVLIPAYRGTSGRGEEFASYGRGVGKYDYEDIITITDHAIKQGLADLDRLVVAGWSQGGYLSYLSSVRNGQHGHGWNFKAVISGAGVTDWDSVILSSDMGYMGAVMAHGKPWQLPKTNVDSRLGSGIWEFDSAIKAGVKIPPMLILHGEQDERVPTEQAKGMRRALVDAGLEFEYVTYPREGHIFQEKRHLVDMGLRVVRWVGRWIGSGVEREV
jgi:dipeptidyl aminopeptidase/acylaminoacyl peptidase